MRDLLVQMGGVEILARKTWRAVHARVERYFRPREIIVRSDGKIRYVRLSSRSQMLGAAIIGGVALLSVVTSIDLALQQVRQHGRDLAVHGAETAYTGLLAEVADYFDRFKGSTDKLDRDEAFLLGLSPADEGRQTYSTPDEGRQTYSTADEGRLSLSTPDEGRSALPESARGGDALDGSLNSLAARIEGPTQPAGSTAMAGNVDPMRGKLRAALKERLAAFSGDLKRIAARNQSLTQQIAELRSEVRRLEGAQMRVADERGRLTADLESSRVANLDLSRRLGDLSGQLAGLRQQHRDATARNGGMALRIGELEVALAETRTNNAALAGKLEQSRRNLASVEGQRNNLQIDRAELARMIDDLKGKLASVQESQATFVANVAERARNSLDDMEKIVTTAGLEVDKLLSAAGHETAGTGGPFIPDLTIGSDANEQKLLENVANLDDEVSRWEKLQIVLHSIPLSAPVDQYYISSGFGGRLDPFNGKRARHEGLDMVGALRSDVLATAPGTVVFVGWRGNYGRMIEIDHGLGIHTLYAHLDSTEVKAGDSVGYRQMIGKLGNSGRSSGPHVHYEVQYNGKALDPVRFLKAGRYVFKG